MNKKSENANWAKHFLLVLCWFLNQNTAVKPSANEGSKDTTNDYAAIQNVSFCYFTDSSSYFWCCQDDDKKSQRRLQEVSEKSPRSQPPRFLHSLLLPEMIINKNVKLMV